MQLNKCAYCSYQKLTLLSKKVFAWGAEEVTKLEDKISPEARRTSSMMRTKRVLQIVRKVLMKYSLACEILEK